MSTLKRFGRGFPLPSTASIKHELKMMEATNVLIAALDNQKCDPEELSQIIAGIGESYQMAPAMIVGLQKHYAVR